MSDLLRKRTEDVIVSVLTAFRSTADVPRRRCLFGYVALHISRLQPLDQNVLYSSHLPFNVILQRASPWLPVTFSISSVKSMALIMPSPNISFA